MNPVSFGHWTLGLLTWRGDEHVLDVGCGPGSLLVEMARHRQLFDAQGEAPIQGRTGILAGFDLSPGMVSEALQSATNLPVHFFTGDAQAIPTPKGTFDVVMARHMLYHVPNIGQAVVEAARVLRPGGRFVATTNSAHTMPEYHALRWRASARFPGMADPGSATHSFSLENGTSYLQAEFERIEVHTLPGTLRFPTAQPFMDYFASSRALIMCPEHTEAEWQTILDFVRREVETIIDRKGHFDVTKLGGALIAVRGD
jgi:ubiquinone/menaquinone biosynthesis C-methylase UbiE